MSMSMSKSGSMRDRSIPRRPLLWLAAALLFTLPPMFGSLVRWVPYVFLLALAMKFWMEPRGYRLRPATLKLILAAMGLFAIFASYGSLKGVEPGISLLVVLVSVKVLEAHTAREFQVMVLMGWVLCLCGFLLSQDFVIALSLLTAFALLLVALIQFYRGSSPGAFWPPLGTTGKILLQAAPLIILLFVLFPRINTGLRVDFRANRFASTGFSDRLSPGSIAALANSSEIAFRAEFPGSTATPPGSMYWRGVVMWHCDGMEWRAPYVPVSISSRDRGTRQRFTNNTIRQRITLAPHGARWMFALDRPFESTPGAILARGDYLWSVQTIRKARRYEVVSSLGAAGKDLTPGERREALEVPPSISPAVRELAQSWTTQNPNPRAIVNSALQFFQAQGFRYSLTPGEYRKNDLEQFLFHRRVGFCEHYAASFATLMRLAGVPARVVVGYLGGEYNDLGHFFRATSRHACVVRGLVSRQRMDTSGSNHRSRTWASKSRSTLVFRKRHRFRANGSSPKRVPHAVSPVPIIHQRSPRLGDTELRVGHSGVGLRCRRTRSVTGLNGPREPRNVRPHYRNHDCRNRTARNLFRLDAIAHALTRGPGEDVL